MASELERFRDYARRMAAAGHGDACEAVWHEVAPWGGLRETRREKPDPHCPGCVNDADRALFARLADEIDGYLAGEEDVVATSTEDEPLWEDA